MKRYAIIDADTITYSVPFSCQQMDSGLGIPAPTASQKEMCKRIDNLIESVLDAVDADEYQLFLTGDDYLRKELCPNYKQNRKSNQKPIYYQDARDYLISKHGAEVSTGTEADDEVCIEYNQSLDLPTPPIICHIDKDIDQLPGLHYRLPGWGKEGYVYSISQEEALYNLYSQSLIGDSADNITGVRGIGPVKAKKLLKPLAYEEVKLYDECYKHYIKECPDTGEERLERNMHLLYLKRAKDDAWKKP